MRRVVSGWMGALVLGALLAWSPPAAADESATFAGTIDWNDLRQEIDGFGASGAFGQAGLLMAYPPADRRHVLDLLFCPARLPAATAPLDGDGQPVCQSAGIGASIVRNQIKVCGVPGYACWKDQDIDQQWLMREAKARGTDRFFATPWSAPGYMKTNRSSTGGGEVRPELYKLYASYLADYALQMRDLGFPMQAVSVSNEPEVTSGYDSMNWTGSQFHDFVRDGIEPVFRLRGVDTKVMLPESVYWSEEKAVATLDDPATAPRLDIVAAHGYGQPSPQPFLRAKAAGKRVWETEDSNLENGEVPNDPSIENAVDWAAKINAYLTQPEVNAWSYWWFVTEKASGEALVNLDVPASRFLVNKRMWAMGNYSRFIRPGWQRIGTTVPASKTTLASAFKDAATGQVAVVVVNNTGAEQAIDLRLNGFAAGGLVPYTTSATQDLAAGPELDTSSGTLATTLAPRSVTTFVGTGVTTSPLHVRADDAVVWRGQPTEAAVTVRNLGPTPVTATVAVASDAPVDVAPASGDVVLQPGAAATVPFTLSADTLAGPIEVPLRVVAQTADGPATAVTAASTVRAFTTFVDLCPNTAAERVFLHENTSFVFPHPNWDCAGSNPRFADATTKATYRFDVPADTRSGSVSLDIGNQFLVETSADGVTWRTVLEETDTGDGPRNLRNKRVRTVDLTELATGHVVYIRMGDSQPADGWGGFLTRLRVDLVRDDATPVVPDLPLPAVAALCGAAVALLLARRRAV
jgi:glucuronoarabinoxylan endo-1,4-beta-xylanase